MTIGEAIAAVQTIKQTALPRAQLVRWLDEVDQTIYRELIRTHEYGQCLMFDGHDPEGETGADTELLLAVAPYDRLYIYFLCAQIDMQNQEFDLYQNNAALYNLAYNDYAAYYARQMRQQKAPRFNAWAAKASACRPLIRPHEAGCCVPSSVCAERRHLSPRQELSLRDSCAPKCACGRNPPEGEGRAEGEMTCCCQS